ncbi:hypothetical protein [Teredinibacter sp. KSP-S5-2]|uniref:hypothetical protein n=1 Tax=Teredinibacter sp. KSP-S5-2 TaxID=3034506 RepID=UPI002934243D|nr:hypothetical protein [Teredinibacter sp. KSP-S5-2]WNO09277.1 hypothetical protein P5V12_20245 [Teredinibacter sp. KSP-S5-2]
MAAFIFHAKIILGGVFHHHVFDQGKFQTYFALESSFICGLKKTKAVAGFFCPAIGFNSH